VTSFETIQAERAGWQRRAARELAAILDAHRDLPVIAWTVASAGATLVGNVSGPFHAGQVRQVFHEWRTALTLVEHSEVTVGAGNTYLRAAVDRNRVQVRLAATVYEEVPNGAVTA
jgi:hypothetical protein